MKHNFTAVPFYYVADSNFMNTIKTDFVIISAVSPEFPKEYPDFRIALNPYCVDILRLYFHDYNSETGEVSSLVQLDGDIRIINNEDVKKILDFAEKYSYIDKWLIHCEAGISRSTAISLALSEIMNEEKEHPESYVQSLNDLRFHNLSIKKKILNTYYQK